MRGYTAVAFNDFIKYSVIGFCNNNGNRYAFIAYYRCQPVSANTSHTMCMAWIYTMFDRLSINVDTWKKTIVGTTQLTHDNNGNYTGGYTSGYTTKLKRT